MWYQHSLLEMQAVLDEIAKLDNKLFQISTWGLLGESAWNQVFMRDLKFCLWWGY